MVCNSCNICSFDPIIILCCWWERRHECHHGSGTEAIPKPELRFSSSNWWRMLGSSRKGRVLSGTWGLNRSLSTRKIFIYPQDLYLHARSSLSLSTRKISSDRLRWGYWHEKWILIFVFLSREWCCMLASIWLDVLTTSEACFEILYLIIYKRSSRRNLSWIRLDLDFIQSDMTHHWCKRQYVSNTLVSSSSCDIESIFVSFNPGHRPWHRLWSTDEALYLLCPWWKQYAQHAYDVSGPRYTPLLAL